MFYPTCNLELVWWKSFPAFSARGMAFQVSCGGCQVRGSGYKISLTTVWVGLNGGFTCDTVVNIVLPVKVGVD